MSPSTSLMKTHFAILGATGQTGSALLQHLLDSHPSIHLHLYARSAEKLHSQHLHLSSHSNVTIHTGPLSDASLLTNCLRPCSVIFSVLATNTNAPGTSIAQDAAKAIISALTTLRDEYETSAASEPTWSPTAKQYQPPTVIVLSAAPLSPTLTAQTPRFATWFAFKCLSYLYTDLLEAARYYREEHAWVPMVQAMSGGLVDVPLPRAAVGGRAEEGNKDVVSRVGVQVKGKSTGHEEREVKDSATAGPSSTEGDITISLNSVTPIITYHTLARGMVQIALNPKPWHGQDVGFLVSGKDDPMLKVKILANFVRYMLPGLVYTSLPWVYRATHS